MMSRDASLSDSCTPHHWCFCSLEIILLVGIRTVIFPMHQRIGSGSTNFMLASERDGAWYPILKTFGWEKTYPRRWQLGKVIRSESGAPITTPILLEGDLFFLFRRRRTLSRRMGEIIGAQLLDLISVQAANIWGKLFLCRTLFILDLYAFHQTLT